MTNLFKAYKTTVVGILLIGAGIYTGVTAKASWGESSIAIAAGVSLLGMNDKIFKRQV